MDTTPTLSGFLTFIRNVMGISASVLPDNSPWIEFSFTLASEIVLPELNDISPILYTQAVYNLSGSTLLYNAQDTSPSTYFADLREANHIVEFVAGVVQSSGDQGTNSAWMIPDAFKGFLMSNLQQLRDPYGRAYLAIVQSYGPVWGIS